MLLALGGCGKDPVITDTMLDGEVIFDPSLYNPEEYLVSYANPTPTPEEAAAPVIIAVHGYSATTFEWNTFRERAALDSVPVSQVLLGGHGRTYDDFKNSTWQDWQSAIMEEYERLVNAGYTNVSLLTSSTGGALVLELLASGYFDNSLAPNEILLVDPIVVSSDKTLSMVGIVGPMLGYIESGNTAEEDKYWYHFRPQETLQELQKVITRVRKELQRGITLPPNSQMKVYKSDRDPVADAVSAVMIYKGVSTDAGKPVEIDLVDSEIHVFTSLQLRHNPDALDFQNQEDAFFDILERVGR